MPVTAPRPRHRPRWTPEQLTAAAGILLATRKAQTDTIRFGLKGAGVVHLVGVARQLRLTEHTVHRALRRLIDEHIVRTRTLVGRGVEVRIAHERRALKLIQEAADL